MNSEQLRLTVVRATIPLIGEYETLTMARIARTAGIGEADLLAVFADREAVLQACVAALTFGGVRPAGPDQPPLAAEPSTYFCMVP